MCVCLSVCLCMRSGRTGQSAQWTTLLKCLKLRTPNLVRMFPGTVRTWLLNFFQRGGVIGVTRLPKFSGFSSSKTVKSYGLQIWHACFRVCTDIWPLKIYRKGSLAIVTWPPKIHADGVWGSNHGLNIKNFRTKIIAQYYTKHTLSVFLLYRFFGG